MIFHYVIAHIQMQCSWETELLKKISRPKWSCSCLGCHISKVNFPVPVNAPLNQKHNISSQSPNTKATLDSILISLFLELSKQRQICNPSQKPCPFSALLLLTLCKSCSCPNTPQEEYSTACEALHSSNPWIVFPWIMDVKLIIKLFYFCHLKEHQAPKNFSYFLPVTTCPS